jgi:hypothetical protein
MNNLFSKCDTCLRDKKNISVTLFKFNKLKSNIDCNTQPVDRVLWQNEMMQTVAFLAVTPNGLSESSVICQTN